MKAHRDAGFTLIELLVSLTLLGLLFVLLFGGLRFGMRAWERGTTTVEAVDMVRSAQDFLRSEIERTCPRRYFGTSQNLKPPRVDFTGNASSLSLLAPAPGSGRNCAAMTLQVLPDGKLSRLVLRLSNNAESDLLRNVQSAAFSYRASGADWQPVWIGQADLPAMVRLRVTFPIGDARVWPELFIAPRISAEADCTYDPSTRSCRGG